MDTKIIQIGCFSGPKLIQSGDGNFILGPDGRLSHVRVGKEAEGDEGLGEEDGDDGGGAGGGQHLALHSIIFSSELCSL